MASADTPKIHYDWEDIWRMAAELASILEVANFKPARIIAVARGGVIPGAILQRLIPRAELLQIHVSSYHGEVADYPRIISGADILTKYDDARTLILDDICDSGNTFRMLQELAPHPRYACLCYRPAKGISDLVTYSPVALPREGWVVFPWEMNNA